MTEFAIILFEKLNSVTVVQTSGFLLGFIYTVKFNKQTLKKPLTTILNASFKGIITAIGSLIVGGFLPPNVRFIIPIITTISCIYYKMNDLRKYKKIESKTIINKNTNPYEEDCKYCYNCEHNMTYTTMGNIEDEDNLAIN